MGRLSFFDIVNTMAADRLVMHGAKASATMNWISFSRNMLTSAFSMQNIDGLVQDCSNSIANALELLQSCPKLSYAFWPSVTI